MFSGIIRHLGTMAERTEEKDDAVVLWIKTELSKDLHEGDSVAVNGVCLTVLHTKKSTWQARLMQETIQRSNLGQLAVGDLVNIEQPLSLQGFIDGHLVQGHVDGTSKIRQITQLGDDRIFSFQMPEELASYLIPKGSIALDGVSLTVVEAKKDLCTVSIMPYTLDHTTFGKRQVGDIVNVEIDMISKYVKSFVTSCLANKKPRSG